MSKSLRYWLTVLLTGVMLMSNASYTFAATEEIGPGIELQKKQEEESRNAELNAGNAEGEAAGETEGETAAVDGESPDAAAASEIAAESAAAAAAAAAQAASPMNVPQRQPHLQTTVLWTDGAWSTPFVNDQWIYQDGKTFMSISIFLTEIIGNIHYRAYTSSNGWTAWAMNGQQTNLPDNWAPIEAVQIRFSGPVHNDYDLYYTASLTNGKETSWAKSSASAGTMNQELALTGFRMAFFAKGSTFSYSTSKPVESAHADGIQVIDGVLRYIHGDGSNFTGWARDDLDRYYFNDSYPVTGWQYIDGYKFYFAEDGKLVQDLEPVIGANGPYLIRINKEMNAMTIYVQDGANGYIIPLKTFLTSTGDDTPLGSFKTPEKYRWRLMNSGVYAQYATRLGGGLPFLMHSIIYDRPDTYTAWASTYNHLGVARSAGCIRLLSSDAKWVFDHCGIGTTIEVYNNPIPGPYDRPTIPSEIPFAQNWDPSDPNITEEGIAAATAAILAGT